MNPCDKKLKNMVIRFQSPLVYYVALGDKCLSPDYIYLSNMQMTSLTVN